MPSNCWDKVVPHYLDFWVPRLIPYHEDLVRKSVPRPGERVLVTAAGPGAELLPISRAMEGRGELVATDTSEAMIEHAKQLIGPAEIKMPIELRVADASDTLGRRWDLIMNAFGMWQLEDRIGTLSAWRDALADGGRVALLVWGPPDPDGPFELVGSSLQDLEPALGEHTRRRELAARESMATMLEQAGLQLVRHAVVRNVMEFGAAEGFFKALFSGCSYVQFAETLGRERIEALAQAFYARLSPPSPRTPLSFAPAAAIAIAERAG
ncbi:MAG: methyltransferase domain-containing protein [Deltaproteobacteria bacterium]|nr:methyltransferase domain-containing protein [Deltaproteobacteria bacterium]